MRLLILSDIHANIYALEAIERWETWDAAYCCGDLVDFGPFAAETIRWVQAHRVLCVCGNHDKHVLSLTREACHYAYDERKLTWAHDNYLQLDDGALDYLAHLPGTLCFEVDGIAYQMQHQFDGGYGTVESMEQFDSFWIGNAASYQLRRMLFGHTHRQGVHWLQENALWLNPGSASYRRPDDHDKRAHYMMIENGIIRFGAITYDRSPLLRETKRHLQEGRMIDTNLQDAFFFFGDAATTRDPLPERKEEYE